MSRRAAPPVLVEPCRGRLQHVLRCTPEVGGYVDISDPHKQFVVRYTQVNHPHPNDGTLTDAYLVVLQLGTSTSSFNPQLIPLFTKQFIEAVKSVMCDNKEVWYNRFVPPASNVQIESHPFCFLLYPIPHPGLPTCNVHDLLKEAAGRFRNARISVVNIPAPPGCATLTLSESDFQNVALSSDD